jgi:hypothetical protein
MRARRNRVARCAKVGKREISRFSETEVYI